MKKSSPQRTQSLKSKTINKFTKTYKYSKPRNNTPLLFLYLSGLSDLCGKMYEWFGLSEASIFAIHPIRDKNYNI